MFIISNSRKILINYKYLICKFNYERTIRSLLLIITKAIPIADTTTPPATKLDIKFDNEAVISNSVFF